MKKLLTSVNALTLNPMKGFAGYNLYVAEMMTSVFSRVQNIIRRGENAHNQHFLLLPQCILKVFLSRRSKVIVW